MDVKSLVTEEGLERLNRILVFVFSRLDNADFKAESTRESLRVLQGRGGRVGRRVFEGFGHMDCWIGDRAAGAVFKAIEEEVRRMMGGSDAMRWMVGSRSDSRIEFLEQKVASTPLNPQNLSSCPIRNRGSLYS
jgi:hypothetical protein